VAKRVSVDKWLFGVTLVLIFAGLVMIFSASAVVAKENRGTEYYFVVRQLLWVVAGLGLMFGLMNLDYKVLKSPAIVFACYGITSLMLIAVYAFPKSNGAHRWIRLGLLSFQPSELAKPAIILFLAWYLESRTRTINERNTLLTAAVPALLFVALIAKQPDLGTALICCAILAAVLMVAGMRPRYLGYATLASLPLLYLMVFRTAWRMKRILAFIDPYKDPQGSGFHMIQSLIAVGTGGLSGAGLMEGKQKLFYLPEPQTDFIFAVIAEEFGLIGALTILVLFSILVWRGLRVAIRTRDNYARFLATGITTMLGVQAFFNISVVLGVLPTKGIPLPLVSYGGSSVLVNLVCIGVLLNITQQTD